MKDLLIILFCLFIIYVFYAFETEIIDIKQNIKLILTKQNKIILLLSKEYPDMEYIYKIKRKIRKMEKSYD